MQPLMKPLMQPHVPPRSPTWCRPPSYTPPTTTNPRLLVDLLVRRATYRGAPPYAPPYTPYTHYPPANEPLHTGTRTRRRCDAVDSLPLSSTSPPHPPSTTPTTARTPTSAPTAAAHTRGGVPLRPCYIARGVLARPPLPLVHADTGAVAVLEEGEGDTQEEREEREQRGGGS